MPLFDLLAEQRIEAALREGAFDDLPGRGKPLALDDDRLVPEEARVGYRILKNAGFVPPELALHQEIASLRQVLATLTEAEDLRRGHARLAVLQAALDAQGRGALLRREGAYRARLLARLSGRR